MTAQTLYWIWLTGIPLVGPVMQKKLLGHFGTPEAVYQAGTWELSQIPGMGPALLDRIRTTRSLEHAQRILETMMKKNIHLLTFHDRLYPDEVKVIPRSPIILYYRGLLQENSRGVGIIGSRHCTPYGKQVTVETADFLARHHIPIISGMAKGIDGYAHTACLKANGYTLAFLGSGVDICYPKEHQSLMDKMVEQGAVLSSYPPGTRIHPHHFYDRNFLISTWSAKLLVIEAGEKSGAMSTVNFAKQLKREIWAVPNHIYCQESKGTNQLIAQGAHIFLYPQQLTPSFSEMEIPNPKLPQHHPLRLHNSTPSGVHPATHLSNCIETKIVEELKSSQKTIDQLAQSMEMNHSEIIERLSFLELEGMIRVRPNHMVELL